MVMAIGSGGISKVNHTVAGISGGLVGIVSLINTSAAKFLGLTMTQKAVYTASQVLGPDLTWAIIGGTGKSSVTINNVVISKGSLPQQSINPWGALNSTTYGGIALLILDYVTGELTGNKFGMGYARPWFKSLGLGLVFGGVVGGVFDPATGIRGGATAGSGPMAVTGRQAASYGANPGGAGSSIRGFAGTWSGA